jgi:transposase
MTHQSIPVYLGVDVAKSELVLDLLNTICRFENSAPGIRKLLDVIARHPDSQRLQLICEPSGGYEQPLVLAALKAARPISLAQPLRVRRYAQALGILAKNDPIDARLLSRFGADLKPAALDPLDEDRRRLTELLNRRDDLIESIQRENHRAEHHAAGLCLRQHRAMIKLLEKQLAQIQAAAHCLIAASSSLHQAQTLLCKIEGVGPQTSSLLLAQMPELGRTGRAQISALAGLAPYDRDSGQTSKKRFIQGGRAKVRRALYMAALTAARCNPVLKPCYQRLRASGKPVKVALIAIARKLLIHLNSLMTDFYKKSLAA